MIIKILSIGKTKEAWLDQAFEEYVKRLKPTTQIVCAWAKSDAQLIEWVSKEKGIILLDPAGASLSSEKFSRFVISQMEKHGARLTFVIGGANGLPEEIKSTGSSISLSPLTFTHQIARLILIEQIYRAFEIDRGSAYHK